MENKFPSLYIVIKNGDIDCLIKYFQAYPNTSVLTPLNSGKKLPLLEQAIKFDQTTIIKWLVDKTPENQMGLICPYILSSLINCKEPTGSEPYCYYINRLCNLIEQTGSVELTKVLESILFELLTWSYTFPYEIIGFLLNNRLLNIPTRLADPNFKWTFESATVKKMFCAKPQVFKQIIQFYQNNEIDLSQLLAHFLIGPNLKSEKIIRLFKSVSLKSKVKICLDNPTQVQLSTLFVIAGSNAKLSELLANPNFESEFMFVLKNLPAHLSRDENFSYFSSVFRLDSLLNQMKFSNSPEWYGISSDYIDYLKLFKSKLTNNLWDWILEQNEKNPYPEDKDQIELAIFELQAEN